MKRNSDKKTILLISNKVYHYRMPVYQHLSKRLLEMGYTFSVLTDEIEKEAEKPLGFDLQVLPFHFARYWRAIKEMQPKNVILFLHARDLIVWPLLVALNLSGTGVIYWNHGVNLQTPDNKLKRIVFGLFHRFADAIILYSGNEKKYIARKYWQKLFVANNAINFANIPGVSESKDQIRKQLGIPFQKVVLFVGRITQSKRLDDLLAAANHLNQDIGVVIVGEGINAKQTQIVDARKNTRYLGAVYEPEAINRIFKMADVFSIPGKVGLGVNQAFYWGLPIVTENVRHSPEIMYVKDGVNGFIVGKHDTRALAEKINFLLADDAVYRRFSEAARSEILENATIDKMCDGFVDAIHFLDAHGDSGSDDPQV